MQNSQCFQGMRELVDSVDNVDIFGVFESGGNGKRKNQRPDAFQNEKISTYFKEKNHIKYVDNVDNHCFKRSSPMFTTSPAPIVINKSLGRQFSKINFSICLKSEKYQHFLPRERISF